MKRLTPFDFVNTANEIHENKYDYSLIKHVYASEKVSIICPIHGTFGQRPSAHLKGNGCPQCGIISRADKRKKSTSDFIKESKSVHGNKYQYDKVDYVNSSSKVTITCPKHGDFRQTPSAHISQKQGCPPCGGSEVLTNDTFISKADEIHNKKYDYGKVNYLNSKTKVTITCPKHGEFEQTPNMHLRGNGCPKCGGTGKSNTKEFIGKAKLKHGEKYNYSKVNYINNTTKVIIICPEHGDFTQSPMKHLQGQGCRSCAGNKKLTTDTFIAKANNRHDDKYSYDNTSYVNYGTKVVITCPEHGDFKQTPRDHLSGYGCPFCGNNIKSTTSEFIEKAHEVHGEIYSYDKIEYVDSKTKVTITCPYHGDFDQAPSNHLNGQGCPICKIPKGELEIMKSLQKRNVQFESQYTFDDCVYKKKLPFDFAVFIGDQICLIEYNGEQHYRSVEYGSKSTSLDLRQKLDSIKETYAEKNGYQLLIIPYSDFENIDKLIDNFINKNRTANNGS